MLKIDYVEFASEELEQTEAFFKNAFGWEFVEYGDDYRDIQGAGIGGGLERAKRVPPLVVLKSDDLEKDRERILEAGAELVKDIFEFPGGRRFEFREPGGNLMAVWQEV